MIRRLHALDTMRLPLWQAPWRRNWATPRRVLACRGARNPSALEFLRKGLLPQRHGITCVCQQNGATIGVISGQVSPASRLWEVDLLSVDPRRERECQELLEGIVAYAGRHGGHRVALRLPAESPLIACVCRAGFVPSARETLYRSTKGTATGLPPTPPLRKRKPQDDHALFRLYCAAVPAPVRAVLAMTMEQWQELQEPCAGAKSEEFVLEGEDAPVAWLRLQRWGHEVLGEVLVHPHWERHLPAILGHAQQRAAGRQLCWLAAEYQPSLARHLAEQAYAPEGEFVFLVKPLSAPARQRAAMPVSA